MMWPDRSRFTMSTIAASVVDLPEPVGPVTTTNPRWKRARSVTTLGIPRSSTFLISNGITRNTAPTASRCWNTFTRNRERPGSEYDMSSSSSCSNRSRSFCGKIA